MFTALQSNSISTGFHWEEGLFVIFWEENGFYKLFLPVKWPCLLRNCICLYHRSTHPFSSSMTGHVLCKQKISGSISSISFSDYDLREPLQDRPAKAVLKRDHCCTVLKAKRRNTYQTRSWKTNMSITIYPQRLKQYPCFSAIALDARGNQEMTISFMPCLWAAQKHGGQMLDQVLWQGPPISLSLWALHENWESRLGMTTSCQGWLPQGIVTKCWKFPTQAPCYNRDNFIQNNASSTNQDNDL